MWNEILYEMRLKFPVTNKGLFLTTLKKSFKRRLFLKQGNTNPNLNMNPNMNTNPKLSPNTKD